MSSFFLLFLVTSILGIYLFLILKEKFSNNKKIKDYLICAEIVHFEINKNFAELKDKNLLLVEDKGYGVFDERKWEVELINFISLVINPKINKRIGNKSNTASNEKFVKDLVNHLISKDIAFPDFSAKDYLDENRLIKNPVTNNLSLVCWGFSAFFIVIGVHAANESVWISAVLTVFAGLAVNPFLYLKIFKKELTISIYGPIIAFIIAVISLLSYLKHDQAISIETAARAQESHRQNTINQQLLAEKNRKEAERIRLEFVEQEKKRLIEIKIKQEKAREEAKLHFNENKEEIIQRLKDYIEQGEFNKALESIEEYKIVKDSDFLELKSDIVLKNKKNEERLLAEAAEAKRKSLAEAAEAKRQKNYNARIRPYAIDTYSQAQYPKLYSQFRHKLPEIEKLRRMAAEQVVDQNKCDYIENVQLTMDSKSNKLRFFIDCEDGNRIYLTEADIKNKSKIVTEAEKAWDEFDAFDECRKQIKRRAEVPSSVDFYLVTGTHIETIKETGLVIVQTLFDAKNIYGTKIEYIAECRFEPGKQGTVQIQLR